MAFPQVQARSSGSFEFVSSFAVALPSGVTAGDVLLVLVTGYDSRGFTATAGWNHGGTSFLGAESAAVYWKVASGSDNLTLTPANSSSRGQYLCSRWAGAVGVQVAVGSGLTQTPPLTPTTGVRDYVWIAFRGGGVGDAVGDAPPDYGNLQTRAASGFLPTIASAERQLTAASEDPGDFAGAGVFGIYMTVGVIPPAGGTEQPGDTTPPTITSTANHSVNENTTYGATATANESVTWAKGGTNASLVTLNTATGAWSIAAQDHETRPVVSFTLTATDTAGNPTTQTVTVNINDLDEIAPTITSAATGTVQQGTAFSVSMTASEAVTWSKISGSGSVSGSTLAYAANLSAGTYETVIRATDAAGNYSQQTHTLTVTVADTGGPGSPGSPGVTGWKTPGSLASIPDGTRSWSPVTAATLSTVDAAVVRATGINSTSITHVLRSFNFGFTDADVPAAATITGLEVEIVRRRSFGSGVPFARHARLSIDSGVRTSAALGDQIGTNNTTDAPWVNTFTTAPYGGAADLWGASLTPAMIKAATFGFDYGLQGGQASMDASIDQLRMRVHFTTPGTPQPTIRPRRTFHWH